jgi:hypothetical protein
LRKPIQPFLLAKQIYAGLIAEPDLGAIEVKVIPLTNEAKV